MDHDRMHEDLRGDIWCFVILGMLAITIAAVALVWLVVQQAEISHLTNQVAHQSHSSSFCCSSSSHPTQHAESQPPR